MSNKISITLIKSSIGRPPKCREILKGLGLTRLNKTVNLDNSAEVRGMIKKVIHLVETKEIKS
jgi:large subunit ribosomal protein L30